MKIFQSSEFVWAALLGVFGSFMYRSVPAGFLLGSTMVLFWTSFRIYANWEGKRNFKNLVTLLVSVILFSWSAYELSVVRYSIPGEGGTHAGEHTTWFAAPHQH